MIERYPLEANDVTAMNWAEEVLVGHGDGFDWIKLRRQGKVGDVFPLEHALGNDRIVTLGDPTNYGYTCLTRPDMRLWDTARALIRTGDMLGLTWEIDVPSKYANRAGLHVDHVILNIWRGHTQLPLHQLMLGYSVAPEKTVFRMARLADPETGLTS